MLTVTDAPENRVEIGKESFECIICQLDLDKQMKSSPWTKSCLVSHPNNMLVCKACTREYLESCILKNQVEINCLACDESLVVDDVESLLVPQTPAQAAAAAQTTQEKDLELWNNYKLLAGLKECAVCRSNVLPDAFSVENITEACNHPNDAVCKTCMMNHIEAEVNGKGDLSIKCPIDRKELDFIAIRRLARHKDFERYDSLLLRNTLSKMQDFRFYKKSQCGSGQIHDGSGGISSTTSLIKKTLLNLLQPLSISLFLLERSHHAVPLL